MQDAVIDQLVELGIQVKAQQPQLRVQTAKYAHYCCFTLDNTMLPLAGFAPNMHGEDAFLLLQMGQGLQQDASVEQARPQSVEAWLRQAEQRAADGFALDILNAIFDRHADVTA